MAKNADVEAHIKLLRALCEQADALRKHAESLCADLEVRIAALRAELPMRERRALPRHKTR